MIITFAFLGNYENLKTAVEDAKTRYESTLPIDPYNPIQSATPLSTTYDKKISLPKLKEVKEKYEKIEHEHEGIVSAYILYNFNSTNETNWSNAEMHLFGGEGCEDEGKSCVGTKNPLATTIVIIVAVVSGLG